MAQGASPSVSMTYSVSLDAKNLLRGVVICTIYNTIVGGVFPQHYISLYGKRYDEINKMIHEVNKDEFEKANEIKIAVICLQTIVKGHSPYMVVCRWTQPNNSNNTFGDAVLKACVKVSKRIKTKPVLLNVSMGVVSCELA